jgi:hypothetical protein
MNLFFRLGLALFSVFGIAISPWKQNVFMVEKWVLHFRHHESACTCYALRLFFTLVSSQNKLLLFSSN